MLSSSLSNQSTITNANTSAISLTAPLLAAAAATTVNLPVLEPQPLQTPSSTRNTTGVTTANAATPSNTSRGITIFVNPYAKKKKTNQQQN
jgi:hypothetical protein